MRRLIPLLSLALALPASASVAAPKKPSSKKKKTTKAPKQAPPKPKRPAKPCPDVTFTPPPLTVEGVYASDYGPPFAVPLNISVKAKPQGVGLLIYGHMAAGDDAGSRPARNHFFRLDEIPIKGQCQVANEQRLSQSITVGDPVEPICFHDPIVKTVDCTLGEDPTCKLSFESMTIEMESRPTGCQHDRATFEWRKTVVARQTGAAPRRALPSIDIRLESRNESAGEVQYGVLTAVGPGLRRKHGNRNRMYRGTFAFERSVNPKVISTLYPGCAAEVVAPFPPLRFTPSTTKADVVMEPPSASGGALQGIDCSWHGRGRRRVMACHFNRSMISVHLTDDLY